MVIILKYLSESRKKSGVDYIHLRDLGKCFLRNLNLRIHRDITGEMWFWGGVRCEEETRRII
jgi:hypothetical protein